MTTPARFVPSAALERALIKCQAAANGQLPHLEYFEELAKVCPEIQAAVQEFGLKHAHVDAISRVGLTGVALQLSQGNV